MLKTADKMAIAIDCQRNGNFTEADRLYRQILQAEPEHGPANFYLGLLACHSGNADAGTRYLKAACAAELDNKRYLSVYVEALAELGRFEDALFVLTERKTLFANSPEFLELKARVELSLLDKFFRTGEYEALELLADRFLSSQPENGLAWMLLGSSLAIQKKDALYALEKAVNLLPDHPAAHSNLGNALCDLARYKEGIACYRRALTIAPEFSDAYGNLGLALVEVGQTDEAIAYLRRALAINPNFAEAHSNLGNALRAKGEFLEASRHYREALRIDSASYKVHNNLGTVLLDLGDISGAMASYKRALDIRPYYPEAYSNLLFLRNYQFESDDDDLLSAARQYGAMVESRAKPYQAWDVTLQTDRILRVGIISADLSAHPVGYFIDGVLHALNTGCSGRIEIFAYANQHVEDELTLRLQKNCVLWRNVLGLNDEMLAAQIWADRIDILIDLSGHTAGNRLPVFAWKPAPVQISWLGYFATTGVVEIDYLLVDPWVVPLGDEHKFSERLWRLPETRMCFTPPQEEEYIGPLPALENGFVTLGCFNNLTKMNDAVVSLWSRVLHAIPRSRLYLKAKQLGEDTVRAHTLERFALHGIGPERLSMEGKTPRKAYFSAYEKVDFCLDPFPFTGGTTTAESLWMGVPVLTLEGQCLVSRQGVCLLGNAGLSDWIAKDEDDYVSSAVAHASQLAELANLRQRLRQQVLSSPVFDALRFAQNFEAALRDMWKAWCERS